MHRPVPDDLRDDLAELELCRLFNCTPSQLDREDWHRVNRLALLHSTMEKWRNLEAKSAANRGH